MKLSKYFWCCLLLMGASVFWANRIIAQAPDPADIIVTYMAQDRLPSLSVAVGRNGKLQYAEAFGLADLENSVPATVRTVYRIGSVSKAITASAIMRLSDQPGELFHGGTSVGGSAYLYINVETSTVVALATNVDRWTEHRHEIARALADCAESQ